ncbi:MAG: aminotransferase class V-fold PLP-dependent enzyme, partial [Bacteroidetes bacterium]|nr:aminotransferase class V-fold PLP-dependent enzyme [Bacteroidota bacterium]
SLITERTKLLTICHVSNALGVVNPVRDVISTAHAANVPVLIDAAQSAPHLPIDVQDLDCDFLVFSGHKMYAGTGIGVLYGKERYLEAMPPYQTGGGMIENVSIGTTAYAGLPLKFEAGTPNIVGAISLAAAVDYIHEIGMDDIIGHEQELMRYALQALSSVEDLQIYGPGVKHCGAVSFNIQGVHPYDVGLVVDRMGVAVRTGTHCAEPTMKHLGVTGTIRASFAIYNTQHEVDVLIDALRTARQLL